MYIIIEIIMVVLALIFLTAIFLAYRKDVKSYRAKLSDFYKPFLLVVFFVLIGKISTAIRNHLIDDQKYLIKFNAERAKHDLVAVDTTELNGYTLFKSWQSYFTAVKNNYTLELKPKAPQKNGFARKYIVVKNGTITYEEDTYDVDMRALHVKYDYAREIASYCYNSYERDKNGCKYALEEVLLTRPQCMDTLRVMSL
jgi:hypothetical protein